MHESSDAPSPPEDSPDLEIRMPLDALIAGLSRPAAFGLDTGPVEVIQTHISVVFLAADRAFKLKKPTRLWGLVDYGTLVLRRRWCEEEVRLNRRLAPDVYLGVAPVVLREGQVFIGGEGEVVEHAVVMRRIDEEQSLGARLARGEAGEEDIRAVARLLSAFHAANRLPASERDLVERVAGTFDEVCRQNFDGTPVADNPLFPTDVHERLHARFERRLALVRERIRERVGRGLAVDGHGDIRLDHVVWTDAGWIVMDCCEFAETLRHIDPLSDMAFLSMDLRAHGHAELATVFEAAYAEAAGDADGPGLLPVYRAYRAYVRASVDYHTTCRPELAPRERELKAARAQGYFALSWTETRRRDPPPLLVLRGTSGSGKSHVAGHIAPFLDAVVVRSDVVRKELLGLDPTDRPDDAELGTVYGRSMSARTYAELLIRGRAALAAGHAVLLDATYLRRDSRHEALEAARADGAPFAVLEVTCPPDTVRERLAARTARDDDASDADYAIYLKQVASDEPLDDEERCLAVVHDSRAQPEGALMRLLVILDGQLGDVRP